MSLLKGIGASAYIKTGKVKKIEKYRDAADLEGGEIIVASKISRDMLPKIKKAGAVVTDYGGLTSHVAITLRELKIPCVVGTEKATNILDNDMIVTVDGHTGHIYQGIIEFEEELELFELQETATNLKVNLNIPAIASSISPYVDGVGSIRIENIVIETGKHPYILLEKGLLSDVLVNGIEQILDAFYPKPVWFRTFDIPTDELKNLDGGKIEPTEKNSLLGLRAIYKDLRDIEVLKAEFRAVKTLLDRGYSNLGLKFPFLRDVSEYYAAKKIMKDIGLKPHHDLDVGVSIETPSAALCIKDYINAKIDFVSIGMSDLTMCSLAVDRRGVKVAKHFNLKHPAVLSLVNMVINRCHKKGLETCIAGYAGCDRSIVRKLIHMGMPSISTNPDQILKMRQYIDVVEKEIRLKSAREILVR
ncbi:putative PEP-binding protein [Methanobacterium alcaliphilum]|uniref:putative PEP-binding protein n=1 Tax=Methanobacterium alcaliphilum TaxID=392018 RepID=UPI00200B9053|nr:putative PEP-binding protein [Methanobacterium alcaliphilum]MCK9150616.1 PEP-utilizing enzyme [Methanobacterium alcaliphilum]